MKQTDNEFRAFLVNVLKKLREDRDTLFVDHNVDKTSTYITGDFDKLPVELLKKICYVDAYASVLANYDQIEQKRGG